MAVFLKAPALGSWLTDGKRLVQVVGVDRAGAIETEDVSYPTTDASGDDLAPVVIKLPLNLAGWQSVDPAAKSGSWRALSSASVPPQGYAVSQ